MNHDTGPLWPLLVRGLVPVLGLLVVTHFGVTRFATRSIEARVTEHLTEALEDSGHEWTTLRVSGQRAFLSGRPPRPGGGGAALAVVREATCPTWLGPRVCAISVEGDFLPTILGEIVPAPPTAQAIAACEGLLVGLMRNERLEFASGSATLEASAGPLLDRLAAGVGRCPGVVRVEGHTDSSGDPARNLRLSQARAEAVRAALGSRGVRLDRLVAVGYGQTEPVAGNETAAGRARNRRIELRVQTPSH